MTSLREQALDAAIELLGTQGLKALTHRRVDERAGLPPGSTSNYFRTREALLEGVAEAILDRELRGIDPAGFAPQSVDQLVDLLVALLDRTTGEQRVLTSARLVVFVEAAHRPALSQKLSGGRAAMRAFLEPVLAHLGADDPQTATAAVMACAEGLILHRIARHDNSDVRPLLELVLRSAL
ncbi:TetR/AcrR family transcriptional regulator [Propionibacteriaceae bacterium Y1923]